MELTTPSYSLTCSLLHRLLSGTMASVRMSSAGESEVVRAPADLHPILPFGFTPVVSLVIEKIFHCLNWIRHFHFASVILPCFRRFLSVKGPSLKPGALTRESYVKVEPDEILPTYSGLGNLPRSDSAESSRGSSAEHDSYHYESRASSPYMPPSSCSQSSSPHCAVSPYSPTVTLSPSPTPPPPHFLPSHAEDKITRSPPPESLPHQVKHKPQIPAQLTDISMPGSVAHESIPLHSITNSPPPDLVSPDMPSQAPSGRTFNRRPSVWGRAGAWCNVGGSQGQPGDWSLFTDVGIGGGAGVVNDNCRSGNGLANIRSRPGNLRSVVGGGGGGGENAVEDGEVLGAMADVQRWFNILGTQDANITSTGMDDIGLDGNSYGGVTSQPVQSVQPSCAMAMLPPSGGGGAASSPLASVATPRRAHACSLSGRGIGPRMPNMWM